MTSTARSHLKAIDSPLRSLPPGRIAVLVPAMLRHDQRLLAARASRLGRAPRKMARRGGEVVLIKGALT
ncbi:hypothetical protein [Streptomyces sp. NPDC005538]|uniref:hypothetical protein n=1 Tax=unclassified Streptomyces TaxID=2593676 RepID=UPI0033AD81CA